MQTRTTEEIKNALILKLNHKFGCDTTDATDDQLYSALADVVKDEIMLRRSKMRGERKAQP